ncbi:MazG nucleotide pyrophosphohydrolase domain-containing protein [Patescibacteria group bacterium]
MNTKELQKKSVELVEALDKKYNVNRDVHLSLAQLMEELGELARDINLPRLRHKDIDINNLKGEFADVIIQLIRLAEFFDIDIEDAVNGKIEELQKRYL